AMRSDRKGRVLRKIGADVPGRVSTSGRGLFPSFPFHSKINNYCLVFPFHPFGEQPGMTRVLLTTTSFQDVPGPHHQQLKEAGYELITARGPLPESEMLKLVGDVDAFLCGDDEITPKVI